LRTSFALMLSMTLPTCSPFDSTTSPCDDDLIELDGALRECEVDGDRLP
jgi:hypothetical protein